MASCFTFNSPPLNTTLTTAFLFSATIADKMQTSRATRSQTHLALLLPFLLVHCFKYRKRKKKKGICTTVHHVTP